MRGREARYVTVDAQLEILEAPCKGSSSRIGFVKQGKSPEALHDCKGRRVELVAAEEFKAEAGEKNIAVTWT